MERLKTKAKVLVPYQERLIPGILTISDDFITFQSTDLYVKVNYKIPINQIIQAGKRKKLFFFNRFVYVKNREGRIFRFYLWNTSKVLKLINSLVHKI